MTIDRRKYLYRIKRLEIKSWLKYLMIEGKHVVDYVLGELMTGTDITINNTVEKKFYKFDIKGNSTQDGTPTPTSPVPILSAGDDFTLYEKDFESGAISNVIGSNYSACKVNSTTRIRTVNLLKLDNGKEYKISFNSNYCVVIQAFNENQQLYNIGGVTNTWKSTTFTFSGIPYIAIALKKSDESTITIDDYNLADFKIEQTDGMSGIISEKIVNKNKLDVNVIQERTTNGITMTLNGQTINIKGTATGNANFYMKTGKSIILPAGTYYIQRTSLLNIGTLKLTSGSTTILATGNTDTTFTLNSETVIDGLTLQVSSSVGTIDKDVVLMICSSSLSTEYTPYQEQTYTIPCQQPMRSIGDVRDEFIKVNGNWFERHNIGYTSSYNGETISTEYMSTTGGLDTGASVQYVLETPNDLTCTSEQISILENLPKSYNEQTNIYSLDVTPAYIEAQAYVKKEEVIEND